MSTRKIVNLLIVFTMLNAAVLQPALAKDIHKGISTKKPSVASCYNLKWSDVKKLSSTKKPVSCKKTHTAETYLVEKWTGRNPHKLSDSQRWEIANEICNPSVLYDTAFNYWAYYLPTKSDWKKGARWIRCDAMSATKYDAPMKFKKFSKQMLFNEGM